VAAGPDTQQGHGPWKDERRSPGYLPQGKRRPLALVALLAFYFLWSTFARHHIPKTVLGVFVIVIGLSSFWVAARMNQKRLAEERYVRGPGWWVGWLVSKTSVGFARGFHIALGIGICLLGIAALLTHQHPHH
jgi:xanthine/uracil permease